MSDMLITMCVIAYNEEQNINGILECIKNQDYDHNNMEVVGNLKKVMDGEEIGTLVHN